MPDSIINVPFEIKEMSMEQGTFTGYGSVFGNKDSHGDIVMPGAFANSIKMNGRGGMGVALLWQHNSDEPVGVWTSMLEDEHGLLMQGKLTKGVRRADEAQLLMRDKAIKGLSIGYRTISDEFDKKSNTRFINEAELWEVSLVTFPSNTDAQVLKVKAIEAAKTEREFEKALRDAGLSCAMAKIVVNRSKNFFRDEKNDNESEVDKVLAEIRAQTLKNEISKILREI